MKNSEQPKLLVSQGFCPFFQFEDVDGSYSDKYWAATNYIKGFAKVVVTLKGDFQYRDLLGRITEKSTRTGKAFYKFFTEEITLKQIHVIFFADEVFCKGVKEELVRRQKAKAEEAFKRGEKVSKSKVKKEIESDFNYIDRKHKKALTLMTKKAVAFVEKKDKHPSEKAEQKPDYSAQYKELHDYLESL